MRARHHATLAVLLIAVAILLTGCGSQHCLNRGPDIEQALPINGGTVYVSHRGSCLAWEAR